MSRGRPVQHGISVQKSDRLLAALRRAVTELPVACVFETGTHLGLGSTRLIIDAFDGRVPESFYTIEASPEYYRQAVANLAPYPFVRVVWGLSVSRAEAEAFVAGDEFLRDERALANVYVDSDDPVSFYLQEIRGGHAGQTPTALPDNWIDGLLPGLCARRPLIALDSAGGVGLLEFQQALRHAQRHPFALFLDDVNHVKHYRSLQHVHADSRFCLLDEDFEQGWAVALFTPAD
ncbi:MAG: hypothetical protein U1D55_04335 [Phycisphaerae bacterium]